MSNHRNGRLHTDRGYPLDEPPEVVWQALERVEDYRRWWPWLRELDASGLASGARWHARIRVPMPWSLRIEIVLDDVDGPSEVRASVAGDVEGRATVTVEPSGTGSTIRLRSALAPRHRLLRVVNRVTPGVSRRLHDRVVDDAFRQFAERGRPGRRGSAR